MLLNLLLLSHLSTRPDLSSHSSSPTPTHSHTQTLLFLFSLVIALPAPAVAESCLAAPGKPHELQVVDAPLSQPVQDPLFHARYDGSVVGKVLDQNAWSPRFQVFYEGSTHALAVTVADLLTRFYWYGEERLDPWGAFVEPVTRGGFPIQDKPIAFYLDNTNPGGAKEADGAMYMLQADTPRHPLEVVREVAHEFSHLTVPGIRGFSDPRAPEEWLNGYLGEVLYMGWLAEDTDQAVIPATEVGDWSRARARVLERAFLSLDPRVLQREPGRHYWELAGLLLYLKDLYGVRVLGRLLKVCADYQRHGVDSTDVNLADAMAVENPTGVVIPGDLVQRLSPRGPGGTGGADGNTLRPDEAVRTWVYLRPGRYRMAVAAGGGDWKLRAAEIGSGSQWAPMGVLSAASPAVEFRAKAMGWYAFQWRNLTPTPVPVQAWNWKAIGDG